MLNLHFQFLIENRQVALLVLKSPGNLYKFVNGAGELIRLSDEITSPSRM
jgi:hypothetical protein